MLDNTIPVHTLFLPYQISNVALCLVFVCWKQFPAGGEGKLSYLSAVSFYVYSLILPAQSCLITSIALTREI